MPTFTVNSAIYSKVSKVLSCFFFLFFSLQEQNISRLQQWHLSAEGNGKNGPSQEESYILYHVWSFPVKSFSIQILSWKKKSESRLAVDAAVDNCNDSGRNWKRSILSTITSLLAHWGPGGADKWEIWESTASCESKSDCRYRPFRSTHSLSSPYLSFILLLLLLLLSLHRKTHMHAGLQRHLLSIPRQCNSQVQRLRAPFVWSSAYLLLSDSSASNQHTQEELSFMHWRQWAQFCLSSALLFRFTVD